MNTSSFLAVMFYGSTCASLITGEHARTCFFVINDLPYAFTFLLFLCVVLLVSRSLPFWAHVKKVHKKDAFHAEIRVRNELGTDRVPYDAHTLRNTLPTVRCDVVGNSCGRCMNIARACVRTRVCVLDHGNCICCMIQSP